MSSCNQGKGKHTSAPTHSSALYLTDRRNNIHLCRARQFPLLFTTSESNTILSHQCHYANQQNLPKQRTEFQLFTKPKGEELILCFYDAKKCFSAYVSFLKIKLNILHWICVHDEVIAILPSYKRPKTSHDIKLMDPK